MASTGVPERKRRHISSISPTSATAKAQPFAGLSEDKKVDTKVLQFQNQKLIQKLEAQKQECISLENKFSQLRHKQLPYDDTLAVVHKTWDEVVDDLESSSACVKGSTSQAHNAQNKVTQGNGASSPLKDTFLSRLLETGATESSSLSNIPSKIDEEDRRTAGENTKSILCNIVDAIDNLWCLKDKLCDAALSNLPQDGSNNQNTIGDLVKEVKNLRLVASDLHLKHRSLARELQSHRDADARNKAEQECLRGELESTIAELDESNTDLATLKAQGDAGKGASFPVLIGNNQVASDKARDNKQKDLQDMESALKEILDQSSSRLLEIKCLYERRVELLEQLANSQNTLKNMKCISSSQAYILAKDQLAKAKAAVVQYQAVFERLQVEKDNLAWREKEINLKNDVADAFNRSAAVSDYRITELGKEIKQQITERHLIETKLEEASREPGRKDIITEFKALVSSFPSDMSSMQSQLSKYKEAASDVNSLRADVHSLSNVLDVKDKEWETLSGKSSDEVAEIKKLQAVVEDLRDTDSELMDFLEMYRRESIDSREMEEARNLERKAWAQVQSLNSSLDELNLESRVKAAIEAEAISQQRLAAAEAEIANMRRKFEASKRDNFKLSDALKSKQEENEVYLSEIETTGQAYDDIQTKDQHLLQQITERDDYNIKLVLEGVHARQLRDGLLMEKQAEDMVIQQARSLVNCFDIKSSRIENQVKHCSDQVQRFAELRVQNSVNLENSERRLLDASKLSQKLGQSLEESQSKLDISRAGLATLHIELEKERYARKRNGEELDVARSKQSRLRSQIEGSSVRGKLQQELKEYREIMKCSICLVRPKEVVITKCYHLFCNPCVQKITEGRHRKCPRCSASFGANDVKPVYL